MIQYISYDLNVIQYLSSLIYSLQSILCERLAPMIRRQNHRDHQLSIKWSLQKASVAKLDADFFEECCCLLLRSEERGRVALKSTDRSAICQATHYCTYHCTA